MTGQAPFTFDKYLKYKKKCDKQNKEINWRFVCHYFRLPEEFMEEHANELNWYYVVCNQEMSEEFMKKYADRIVWDYMSNKYRDFSEEFMREMKDYIHWNIQSGEKLSLNFKREFWKELYG